MRRRLAGVFTIAGWMVCIYVLLAVAAGYEWRAGWHRSGVGVLLFVVGSCMNSHAEYQRHLWKRIPQNRGQFHTRDLFRYCRHPNHSGDLRSFSGLCLISGAWVIVVIAAMMLTGCVFTNIPTLDAQLRERYGVALEQYARRTRKLIPFLY